MSEVYPGIQAERVQALNDRAGRADGGGAYVLYWMQQAQRTELNHALEYAVHRANELEQPLLVAFGLTDDYPEARLRHYAFLVEGLADVAGLLAERKIPFVVRRGAPDDVALDLAREASLLVCDRGYLRPQRQWRERVAREAPCPVVQVESDVVVPVELVSGKKETAARTIRPKIHAHLDRFLVPLPTATLEDTDLGREVAGEDVSDVAGLLDRLDIDREVLPVPVFRGGQTEGQKILRQFVADSLPTYAANRGQPQTNDVSHMSKYLHFGQLSPVYIALELKQARADENVEGYLEELIVRRELPMNYVFYEPRYDDYLGTPEWSRRTLEEHARDERPYIYTADQLERAETHDPYWNAAMTEMKVSGYMHNYMRMYWGKKIIEWSATPQEAYDTTLRLNNKYFLDGRDANSFSNVAWVFGQHDRGWTERTVFGKVRYMNAEGLKRKADPKGYVDKVARIAEQVSDAASGPASGR